MRLTLAASFFISVNAFAATEIKPVNPSDQDWQKLNYSAVMNHVLPLYETFAEKSEALELKSADFCNKKTNLFAVRASYISATHAWQRVQHIRFGPIEYDMRHPRIQTWPDRSNIGTKQLNRLLKNNDSEAISQERLHRGSTALQGIPAVERLLYGKENGFFNQQGDAGYQCSALIAITQHLADTARKTQIDWTGGIPDYQQELLRPGTHDKIYETPVEVSALLLNLVFTQLQFIAERKLANPLGKSAEKPRYRKAESWRSGTSIDNIISNLQSLKAFYTIENGYSDLLIKHQLQDINQRVLNGFDDSINALKQLSLPLKNSLSEQEQWQRLQNARDLTKKLHTLMTTELTVALGIDLAFNSLDGD